MRYKNIDELEPGDIIGEDITSSKGLVLLASGFVLTPRSIEGLRAKGVFEVLVDDENSKGIAVSRPIARKTEKEVLNALRKLDIEKVQKQASKMVADLIDASGGVIDFTVVKTLDDYTYQHSYSVGCLAAIVGIASGKFNMQELKNLTSGALLHDIGKAGIAPEILNAPRKLTELEYAMIKEHPRFGFNMLRDNYELSSTIKAAVFQHHENEDGTGYPQGIDGHRIHPFAKIVHIADVFDALTSKRSYREPMSRVDALKYIHDNTNTMFSKTYAKIFNGCVVPYPTGSTVLLSDGREAVVVRNDARALYNPYIRLIGSSEDIPLTDTCCTIVN